MYNLYENRKMHKDALLFVLIHGPAPICQVFLLGMLLAKLRQLLDQHARACKEGCFSWRNPYVIVLQFVAPCGYLVSWERLQQG